MTDRRVVLHVSPHPDDEAIGAGMTLASPGRSRLAGRQPAGQRRRAGRGVPTTRRGGGGGRHRGGYRLEVDADIPAALRDHRPALVISSQPHDGHPAHEAVGRAVRDALAGPDRTAAVVDVGAVGGPRRPDAVPAVRRRRPGAGAGDARRLCRRARPQRLSAGAARPGGRPTPCSAASGSSASARRRPATQPYRRAAHRGHPSAADGGTPAASGRRSRPAVRGPGRVVASRLQGWISDRP